MKTTSYYIIRLHFGNTFIFLNKFQFPNFLNENYKMMLTNDVNQAGYFFHDECIRIKEYLNNIEVLQYNENKMLIEVNI